MENVFNVLPSGFFNPLSSGSNNIANVACLMEIYEIYDAEVSYKKICKENKTWDKLDKSVKDIIEIGISSDYKEYNIDAPNKLLLKGCVEGLLATLTKCFVCDDSVCMWYQSPEGIDGWFYNYFNNKINVEK